MRKVQRIILEREVFDCGKKLLHVAVFDFVTYQTSKRMNKLKILGSNDFLLVKRGRLRL